jgi:hypothetical protein
MQLDMHYYGTYALARAAGLTSKACQIIATAAQFVDDNAASYHIEFQDGGRIDSQATAHHPSSVARNLDPADQRRVWVPFHFLPGNDGQSFPERLLCRKDSPIAKAMVKNHQKYAKQDVGVYLIGIAAHIYADTFAHWGFSGVGSRRNKIDNDSFKFDDGLDPDIADYIQGKAADFFRRYGKGGGLIANVKSWLAETFSGALGHGAVATYPDRPYLKWSFEYEYPKKLRVERDNPKHFLDGCRALHQMFSQFGRNNPALSEGDGVKFMDIKSQVVSIIAFQGSKEKRIKQWRDAAKGGKLGVKPFQIPVYRPDNWMREAANMNSREDSRSALKSNLYRFYQAASLHRQFVLRELLPDNDLIVA